MKKTVLSAVLGLCAAASAALPKPTDHWGCDDPCAPMDPLPQFRSVQNPQRGAVCGETLSSAARVDWDGDGLQDLVLADASGWMTFWRGRRTWMATGARTCSSLPRTARSTRSAAPT